MKVKKQKVQFASGAQRNEDVAGDIEGQWPLRFDLVSPLAERRRARVYGEGACKHGANNWRKGMPFSAIVNHAMAHFHAYLLGDRSEDHLARVSWGLDVMMDQEETNPKMNDLYEFKTTKNRTIHRRRSSKRNRR